MQKTVVIALSALIVAIAVLFRMCLALPDVTRPNTTLANARIDTPRSRTQPAVALTTSVNQVTNDGDTQSEWSLVSSVSAWTERFTNLGLRPSDEVEVCGRAKVQVEKLTNNTGLPTDATLAQAYAQIVAALKKSVLEVDQAMGVILEVRSDLPGVGDASTTDSAYPNLIASLIALARNTQDPTVYAVALRECEVMPVRLAICSSLSSSSWAALDKDNLIPVLAVAHERSQKTSDDTADSSEETLALYRAAAEKPQYNERRMPLSRVLDLPEFVQLDLDLRKALALRLVSIDSAVPAHVLQIDQFCLGDAIKASPQRRSVCDKLAQRIAAADTGVAALDIAHKIGKDVGWPADKVNAISNEFETMSDAASQNQSAENPLSCDDMSKQIARSKQQLDHGERAVYRELLASSAPAGQAKPDPTAGRDSAQTLHP